MHKKHILTLTFVITIVFFSFAQKRNEMDTAALRKAVLDSSSPEGYKALLKKFNETPQFLYANEGTIIYYAKLFQKGPDQFQRIASKKMFNELILQRKFDEAIVEGERLIKTDPVDLKLLTMLLTAYMETKRETDASLTKAKLGLLLNSIQANGKGETDSTTLKVTSVEDEYVLMTMLRLNGKSRKSLNRNNATIDHWIIVTKDDSNGWRMTAEKQYTPKYIEISVFFEVLKPS